MDSAMNLGSISDPILVFGGPYGNLEATQAVLGIAQAEDIPPSRIICTGDVCAYCADPQATADLLRESGSTVVLGNCDENLGTKADSCGCGFGDGTSCDALSRQWYAYADAHLDDTARAWMRDLPRAAAFEMAGRRFRVIHGGIHRINRFIYASSSSEEKRRDLLAGDCDAIIAGHCGLPFTQVIDGRLWHNSGVIGMPANDGTPRTWFSLLTPRADDISVEHRALEYDYPLTARKMRDRGLPKGYAGALESGLWPSLDSLSDVERNLVGQPLLPKQLCWQKGTAISAWKERKNNVLGAFLD